MSVKPTLVIGDCHGHLDRLEALLRQEGLIEDCPDSGAVRTKREAEVVQLGDLGHYGSDTQARDRAIWANAPNWLDVILWGNHDRAVIDGRHFFSGYAKPFPEVVEAINANIGDGYGKLQLAYEAHGFLLTHAGLHASFKYQNVEDELKTDPWSMAEWLNACERDGAEWDTFLPVRDNIATSRGGRATDGGILWRDASESLFKGYRQVFGHSAKDKVRKYETPLGYSYCIDVGNQFNGRLIGMWLPEERVVEVKLTEDQAYEDAQRDAERRVLELQRKRADDPFWADDGPWRQLVV